MVSAIHFCIDFQKVYLKERPAYADWWGHLKDNLSVLIGGLEKRGIPTVYVAYHERCHPFSAGVLPFGKVSKKSRLVRHNDIDLPLAPTSHVAMKGTISAFRPQIASYVAQTGARHIILSGLFEVGKHNDLLEVACVSRSARDFAKAKYNVTIAAEATNAGIAACAEDYMPLGDRKAIHAKLGVNVDPMHAILARYPPDPFLKTYLLRWVSAPPKKQDKARFHS